MAAMPELPGAADDAIARLYAERAARAGADAAREAGTSRAISRLRLVTAGAGATAAVLWLTNRGEPWSLWIAIVAAAVFAMLAVRHAGVERRRERAAGHAALNREGRARVERRWDALPGAWLPPEPRGDPPY